MKSTPAQFFERTLLKHEGEKHSLDPDDGGNWLDGRLVGSKWGVTGAALAKYRKVPHSAITKEVMSKLTKQEAIDLGLDDYYQTNGIDLLPWDAVVASVVDHGYNRGQSTAVRVLQRLIGVGEDGQAGAKTREAYAKWRCKHDEAMAMKVWTAARVADYKSLHNLKYINGWTNRANSFLPGTSWWKANV
jgi:lysozyme family protein